MHGTWSKAGLQPNTIAKWSKHDLFFQCFPGDGGSVRMLWRVGAEERNSGLITSTLDLATLTPTQRALLPSNATPTDSRNDPACETSCPAQITFSKRTCLCVHMLQFYKTSRNLAPPQIVHFITSDNGWDGALQGRFKLALESFAGRCAAASREAPGAKDKPAPAAESARQLALASAGEAAEGAAMKSASEDYARKVASRQEKFRAVVAAALPSD